MYLTIIIYIEVTNSTCGRACLTFAHPHRLQATGYLLKGKFAAKKNIPLNMSVATLANYSCPVILIFFPMYSMNCTQQQ